MEGMYLNIINSTYDKHTVNIILNSEMASSSPFLHTVKESFFRQDTILKKEMTNDF